jgi:hypothetical protein
MGRQHWIVDAGGRIHLHIKVILAVVYALTLYPMIEIGYTMQDDVLLSLAFETKSLSDSPIAYLIGSAVKESIYFGRVWVIYGTLMSYVPFYVHSLVYFKIIAFTSLTLNVVLFYLLLKRLFDSKHFAFLAVVCLIAFLQNSLHHNLITSFVAHFMTGLSTLLAALLCFDLHMEYRRRWQLIGAACLYFLSCFSYELFVLYFGLFFVLALRRIMKENSLENPFAALRPAALFRHLLPVSVPLVVYLTIYVAYRIAFPTNYSGIEIGFSPARYLESVHKLTIGALPASLYLRHHYDSIFAYVSENLTGHKSSLLYILANARAEWLVRGSLLSFLVLMVLRDRPARLSARALGLVVLVCLGLFWVPGILPALSIRYQILVQAGLPMYLVTTFSFYAFVPALAAVLVAVNGLNMAAALRRSLHALAVVSVFSLSILTDYSNYHVGKLQGQIHRKWLIVDDFLSSPEFAAIPENSVMYAPTLWQDSSLAPVVEVRTYWQRYFRALTQKRVLVIKKESDFKRAMESGTLPRGSVYYLKFSQERKDPNQFLVFARLSDYGLREGRPFLRSDEAYIFMRSAYREYTVFAPVSSPLPANVMVDGAPVAASGGYVSIPVDKSQLKSRFIKTHLQSPGLDPVRLTVSNYLELTEFPYNERPSLEHDLEVERRKLEGTR